MNLKFSIVAMMVFGCVTCSKDTYNTTPKLEFESVNATVFPRGSQLNFKLQCTDKEGDVVDTIWVQRVSRVPSCQSSVVYFDSLKIPDFNPPKNVKAQFQFTFNYPGPPPPTISGCSQQNDTLYLRFWMHDKAQHVSDTVNSPDIVLLKE